MEIEIKNSGGQLLLKKVEIEFSDFSLLSYKTEHKRVYGVGGLVGVEYTRLFVTETELGAINAALKIKKKRPDRIPYIWAYGGGRLNCSLSKREKSKLLSEAYKVAERLSANQSAIFDPQLLTGRNIEETAYNHGWALRIPKSLVHKGISPFKYFKTLLT